MVKPDPVKNNQFCGISSIREQTTETRDNGFCNHCYSSRCCKSKSNDMNDNCHRKCPPPYDVLCFYLKRWYSRLAIIFGYIAIILISLILLICAGFFTKHS